MARSRNRRRIARVLGAGAALLGALAGTLGGAGPASASSSVIGSRCPQGDFCLFTGPNATGSMYTYRSSTPDTGWAGRHATTWVNRTRSYSCVFEATNYGWRPGSQGYWWTDPASGQSFGWGDASSFAGEFRNRMLSVRLAPTSHECASGDQYVPWYRMGDDSSAHPFGDFNGNGQSDLVMRSVEGRLWVMDGGGGRNLDLGSGWNSMTALVRHGDFTGDGREDIVARGPAGALYVYPNNGKGGLAPRHWISNGWQTMSEITGVGDLNGDGHADLIARGPMGALYLYPGNGKGGFGARHWISNGWNDMTAIVGVGDLNGDGRPDIVTRDHAGSLWLYPGNGKGGFATRKWLLRGVSQSSELFAIGDADGDGHSDLYATDQDAFDLFHGTGKGGLVRNGSTWQEIVGQDPREYFL